MGGLRVRWRTVAKAGAVLCAALFALRILPSLLAPGPPPPLRADIGLARLRPTTPACPAEGCGAHGATNRTLVGVSAAKALVRGPRLRPRAEPKPQAVGPPAPVSPPTPAPAGPPTQAPYSPPSPPGDGSMEFAPH